MMAFLNSLSWVHFHFTLTLLYERLAFYAPKLSLMLRLSMGFMMRRAWMLCCYMMLCCCMMFHTEGFMRSLHTDVLQAGSALMFFRGVFNRMAAMVHFCAVHAH